MAKNVIYDHVDTLFLAVPSGIASGDPYAQGTAGTHKRVGISGVALTDRDANGNATLKCRPMTVVHVSVIASTDDTSAPTGATITRGDPIYKNASTEVLSADADGILFGFALGTRDANGAYPNATTITSGATASIDVILG